MLGQDGEVTKLIRNNADNTCDIKKPEISMKPISDINLHSIQQGITKLGGLTVAHNFPLSSTRRLIFVFTYFPVNVTVIQNVCDTTRA